MSYSRSSRDQPQVPLGEVSMTENITSIGDWRFKRSKLKAYLGKQVASLLQVPQYSTSKCSLFIKDGSGNPINILSFRIHPDDFEIMKSLWVMFHEPMSYSIGKDLVKLFRMHGIQRSSVQGGDFIHIQPQNRSYSFTNIGFSPMKTGMEHG